MEIEQALASVRFDSAENLEQPLTRYAKRYNHSIPQQAIGHITPTQALKNRQQLRPELFRKRVYNQTGLNPDIS